MDSSINKMLAIFGAQVDSNADALRLELEAETAEEVRLSAKSEMLQTHITRLNLQLGSGILTNNKAKSSLSSLVNINKTTKRKITAADDFIKAVDAAAEVFNRTEMTANQT